MLRPSRRSLVIVALFATCLSLVGTANAGVREPGREVTATFGGKLHTPILAVPCNGRLTRNKFTIRVEGKEQDFSQPADPGLSGHLALKLTWVEDAHSAVLGRMSAVLTKPSSSVVRYAGTGTFVGFDGVDGTIEARGLLDAALYADGRPTARHLVANIAFNITLGSSGRITGGFGDDVPAGPSIAVLTTGRTC